MKALEAKEMIKIVINAIKRLVQNAKYKIKIGKFVSEEIKLEIGLRQDCSISAPYWNNLYIKDC